MGCSVSVDRSHAYRSPRRHRPSDADGGDTNPRRDSLQPALTDESAPGTTHAATTGGTKLTVDALAACGSARCSPPHATIADTVSTRDGCSPLSVPNSKS
uniref:Uncharacterized protein n=1 Tax=Neobodo designis TaxID=312471 RepID=A0A7S1Q579_NEODS|mmetsp:Transcript_31892/g.98691  ORF Transcript_31892/g.98691 Transcript_31892/m.98691 type:complete len:100 (+) Transcript_31892:83-382(+)